MLSPAGHIKQTHAICIISTGDMTPGLRAKLARFTPLRYFALMGHLKAHNSVNTGLGECLIGEAQQLLGKFNNETPKSDFQG